MKQIIDTLTAVVPLIVALAPAELALIHWLRSKTKNGNMQLLLNWGEQAVHYMSTTGYSNDVKKKQAMDFVAQRLSANGLADKFSQQQISATIELAVNQMNKMANSQETK